ncbi:PadR family transcriptional regulator [Streptomyces sp. WELS2]|uniref:PadR family transcriptional regulator n=1 Tax=Streptomyces sp. WELS2 TaxID=2749435 RepID=UPI0015F0E2D0|nr:PadR family transcriptional regulator [Streptomyces sp. WELS2]
MTPLRLTKPLIAVLNELLDAQRNGNDIWGLEICRKADLGPGTVYPILDRLTERGWVTSREETGPHSGRPARRFFEFTPMGHEQAAHVLQMRELSRTRAGLKPKDSGPEDAS